MGEREREWKERGSKTQIWLPLCAPRGPKQNSFGEMWYSRKKKSQNIRSWVRDFWVYYFGFHWRGKIVYIFCSTYIKSPEVDVGSWFSLLNFRWEKHTFWKKKNNPFSVVKCILHFYSRVTVIIEWVSLEIMQRTNGLYWLTDYLQSNNFLFLTTT